MENKKVKLEKILDISANAEICEAIKEHGMKAAFERYFNILLGEIMERILDNDRSVLMRLEVILGIASGEGGFRELPIKDGVRYKGTFVHDLPDETNEFELWLSNLGDQDDKKGN
jgi:hypothetical protein